MKYNMSPVIGRKVSFMLPNPYSNEKVEMAGVLQRVTQNKHSVTFHTDRFVVQFPHKTFSSLLLEEKEMEITMEDISKVISFYENDKENYVSPFVGFTLMDSYGFPVELTQEMCREKDMVLDIEGVRLLQRLNREKSQGTFKNKNAF